jgi:hypothetical protein
MTLLPDGFYNIREQAEDVQESKPTHRRPSIPTLEALRAWAQRLQSHPALKADPNFARQLESRVLERNAELQRAAPQRKWWSWFLPGWLRKQDFPDTGEDTKGHEHH